MSNGKIIILEGTSCVGKTTLCKNLIKQNWIVLPEAIIYLEKETGKKGDEIPLSAQIVAVVSAYCALTEERVYREKFYDREGALEVMDVLAGSYFNDSIYDICKKVSKQFH